MYLSFFSRFLSAALLSFTSIPVTATELPDFVGRISAGTIAAISDGDFLAQTYATGRLAPAEAGHLDLLTVLSIVDGKVTTGTLQVSNSVTAAPEILDQCALPIPGCLARRFGMNALGARRRM